MKPTVCGTAATSPPGQDGLSLVELVVVLAIVGALAGIGLPAVSYFSRDNALEAKALEFYSALSYARTEARSRRLRVVVCRSPDPAAASPACGGSGSAWAGALIFATGDTNSTYEPASDELLRVIPAVPSSLNIIANAAAVDHLEFSPGGNSTLAGTGRLAVCDHRGGDHGWQVDVRMLGRPVLVEGRPGAPISCDSPT